MTAQQEYLGKAVYKQCVFSFKGLSLLVDDDDDDEFNLYLAYAFS